MSCNLIPLHGLLALQSNLIATLVAEVPFMFLYLTPLILTPELCYIHINLVLETNDYISNNNNNNSNEILQAI